MSLWLKSAAETEDVDDSDSSDEDYVPGDAPDVSEEEDEGVEEAALDKDADDDGDAKKRPASKSNKRGNRKRKVAAVEEEEDKTASREDEVKRLRLEAEQEKLRADKLFADFMSDVGKPRSSRVKASDGAVTTTSASAATCTASTGITSSAHTTTVTSPVTPAVTSSVSSPAALFDDSKSTGTSRKLEPSAAAKSEAKSDPVAVQGPARRRRGGASGGGGGLAGLVSSLNRPAKLNVLQRSSLDWESYKTDTSAHDELQQHVRSKDAYLEKQDFLLRTDQRQFEQEKALRDRHRTPRV